MNKHAILLMLFALFSKTGAAQCFTSYFLNGVNLYNKQLYWEAQTQFKAALKCGDATGTQKEQGFSWLDRTTQAYIHSLEEAKNKAESLRQSAEDRLLITEAGHLSLLANWELEKGNPDDALALAYSACEIFPGNPIPPAKLALGNAVCRKYAVSLADHSKAVIHGGFIPESNLLFTLSQDQTVRIWDRKGALVNTLAGHKAEILDIAVSSSGQYLLTASKDKSAVIWNSYGARLHLLQHDQEVVACSFIGDDKTVATCTRDGIINIWNVESGQLITTQTTLNKPVIGISTAPGNDLFLITTTRAVELWNVAGQAVRQLTHDGGIIHAFDFSSDGRSILTAAEDGAVKIWDTQGNLLQTFQKHQGAVRHAAFSSDGTKVFSCGDDRLVIVGDISGQWTYELKGLGSAARFATFSPDDYFVLSESDDGALALWKGQKIAAQFNLQSSSVVKPAFAPDGQSFLAVASGEADTLQLRDMQGDLLMSFSEFNGSITSACFSPDGNFILACAEDGTARLFPIPAFIRRQVSSGAEPMPTLDENKRREIFYYGMNTLARNEIEIETVGMEEEQPAWSKETSESAPEPEIVEAAPTLEDGRLFSEAASPHGGGPSEKITVNATSKSEKIRDSQAPPKQTTEKAPSYPSYMIITETSLREGPHHTRKSLKRLPLGAHLKLLDGNSDPLWARISWDGVEGWAKKSAMVAR